MNDLSGQTTSAAQGLETALMDLSDRLGRPINRVGLYAVFSGSNRAYEVTDAVRAAEHAGFTAQFGALKLGDLSEPLLPLMAITESGSALNIIGKDAKGYEVFDPATQSTRTLTQAELAPLWSGHVLRLSIEHGTQEQPAARRHWFWGTLAEHKWSYIQVLVAAAVSNILGLGTSLFTMVVYDRVLPNEAIESLIALTIGVAIALGFDLMIRTLRARFINSAGQTADRKMAQRIFDQILGLRQKAGVSTGALSSSLREFETLRDFFTSATVIAMVDLPFIFLYIFVIWLIGGPLALVAGAAVPIVILISLAVQPILKRMADAAKEDGQSKQSVLVESIGGLSTIKVTGAAPWLRARWDEAVGLQADHAGRSRDVSQVALNVTSFVQQSAQVLIVFFGVFLIREGVTSMGALIACVILTGRTLGPLAQIAQVLTRINQAATAYRTIDTLMSAEIDRPTDRRWLSRNQVRGDITFDNVVFGYDGPAGPVLNGASFQIQAGEKVAVLGPVGSGKSTLAQLALGLYSPDEGRVLIDGVDLRAIDPGDLRRNMGAQLQDTWLFSGTVKENIAAGAIALSDEHLLQKARIAAVDDFVRLHPHGYDMRMGERGQGLSGGQRQCISLARALIGDPPILVLDEPTANMDVQTEDRVIKALKREVADRTLMVVTHRTSLLALVDRVIVVEQGKVSFDGPKADLLRKLKEQQAKA
ncbi:type I secretion system permease/ATPase [Pseudooceanicola sp. MF1-13]|uniref:type I secretion system permease/ATPase n=1 Tax=Pseudooceanicola sp. MF1-13 TaxID=3379095 RepID=UPI0038917786